MQPEPRMVTMCCRISTSGKRPQHRPAAWFARPTSLLGNNPEISQRSQLGTEASWTWVAVFGSQPGFAEIPGVSWRSPQASRGMRVVLQSLKKVFQDLPPWKGTQTTYSVIYPAKPQRSLSGPPPPPPPPKATKRRRCSLSTFAAKLHFPPHSRAQISAAKPKRRAIGSLFPHSQKLHVVCPAKPQKSLSGPPPPQGRPNNVRFGSLFPHSQRNCICHLPCEAPKKPFRTSFKGAETTYDLAL